MKKETGTFKDLIPNLNKKLHQYNIKPLNTKIDMNSFFKAYKVLRNKQKTKETRFIDYKLISSLSNSIKTGSIKSISNIIKNKGNLHI